VLEDVVEGGSEEALAHGAEYFFKALKAHALKQINEKCTQTIFQTKREVLCFFISSFFCEELFFG